MKVNIVRERSQANRFHIAWCHFYKILGNKKYYIRQEVDHWWPGDRGLGRVKYFWGGGYIHCFDFMMVLQVYKYVKLEIVCFQYMEFIVCSTSEKMLK